MLSKIRKFIPRHVINYSKHLPEAIIANMQFSFPGRKLRVIGVTGTDGKTTTVNMIYKILNDAGFRVSMISTINAVIRGKSYDTGFHVTSPKSSDIQKYLKKALDNGDEYIVLEVTSHALEQFRVWGVKFDIGVITNITHEHLDYHKTFKNYRKAKAKLIRGVKYAVLNRDDQNFSVLSKQTYGKVISFGLDKGADYNPGNFVLKLKIPGDYNMQNALASAAVAECLGIDKSVIKQSLEGFTSLSGRMEEVGNSRGIKIIIDFAHTPNALEKVLKTLRQQTQGKLIAVFGCASERDNSKRPLMGKVAADLADITVLTDEDPRFENSEKIISEIAEGANRGQFVDAKNLFKEPNRMQAIQMAVQMAKKGDIVGIFGKGHEKSMNYQGKELPWSDQEAVKNALKKL